MLCFKIIMIFNIIRYDHPHQLICVIPLTFLYEDNSLVAQTRTF